MLSHTGKNIAHSYDRFDRGFTLAFVPPELVSPSHWLGFARHYSDGTRRKNVTDECTRMVGATI
jgi:hypothetical protein